MKKNMPTMKDIAREAGVALGTVSKVINGQPVGESYRLRVEEAVKKLGYQVNQYARGLRMNKTFTVALILPNVSNPYFASLAQHISQALAQRQYRTLLYLTGSQPEAEQACIHMVRQNKVDGIIGLTYNPQLEVDEDLPFVSIDRCFKPGIPCVSSDNYSGGMLAAEKLLELGCKSLGFMRTGSVQPGEVDKRGDGFEALCRSRGVQYDELRVNDGTPPAVFRAFLEKHNTHGGFDLDGIFCCTDWLAWQTQEMLRDMGIAVPEDVQIIGFDGIRHFGDGGYYCSTIVQPVRQIVETCVSLLLDKSESMQPSLTCLPVRYVPGGTTRE